MFAYVLRDSPLIAHNILNSFFIILLFLLRTISPFLSIWSGLRFLTCLRLMRECCTEKCINICNCVITHARLYLAREYWMHLLFQNAHLLLYYEPGFSALFRRLLCLQLSRVRHNHLLSLNRDMQHPIEIGTRMEPWFSLMRVVAYNRQRNPRLLMDILIPTPSMRYHLTLHKIYGLN